MSSSLLVHTIEYKTNKALFFFFFFFFFFFYSLSCFE